MSIARNYLPELRNEVSPTQIVTVSRRLARAIVDALDGIQTVVGDTTEIAVAFDLAQGEDNEAGRYVLVYIEPGAF